MMLNKRLVLGCLLAICSLLFLASRYSQIEEFDDVALDEPLPPFDPAPELPDKWRPDLQVDRGPARKGPLRVSPRPPSKDPAGSNPKSLPVRLNEDVLPTYRYLSVPSTDDPWPDRPEVADVFFAADRKAHDPPRPVWPDPSAVESSRATRSRLQASDRVRFEDLVPPVPSSSLGARQKLPKVQAEDPPETRQRAQERAQRKQWVERAIRHGWEGYKAFAWGSDEVKPVSNSSRNPFNGWGASIVDALDLFLMLGWEREYALARTHVRALDFTLLSGTTSAYGHADGVSIPTFETTIRYLGGLLSAYDLSGDALMLQRAQELGDWIMGSFGTKSGLPLGKYRLGFNPEGRSAGRVVLSEAGSMSLEFTRLAQLTGEHKYFDVVHRTTEFFDTGYNEIAHPKGLLPTQLSDTSKHLRGQYSMGGMADSYYEYLIKEHQLLAGSRSEYSRMFSEALDSAYVHLMADVQVVPGQQLLVIGENNWDRFTPTLTHLTCFSGAMFGLGSKLLGRTDDLGRAQRLTEACVWAYNVTKSGVAPEGMTFYSADDADRYVEDSDADGAFLLPRGNPILGVKRLNGEYKGRPETIESVFYMWRLTGDPVWQDKGWSMFQAFIEATAVPGGFAAIAHVEREPLVLDDYCESFVFAETLKYYWLLFADRGVFSLDDHVFNTEAHPFNLHTTKPEQVFNVKAYEDLYDAYEEASAAGLPEVRRPVGRGTAFQQQQMTAVAETDETDEPNFAPGFGRRGVDS